jgi:hypothetical protein
MLSDDKHLVLRARYSQNVELPCTSTLRIIKINKPNVDGFRLERSCGNILHDVCSYKQPFTQVQPDSRSVDPASYMVIQYRLLGAEATTSFSLKSSVLAH